MEDQYGSGSLYENQQGWGRVTVKLTIEQNQLDALLGRVTKAVESRNTIPILSNVLLVADGNTITAIATDLDVEVASTAEAQVEQSGSTTVQAGTLQSIVKKLSKGKLVTLEYDAGTLKVSSGRSNLTLSSLPVKDFPRVANDDYKATFNAEQPEIKRMLDLTEPSMSNEETRYYLQGVYLHSHEGTARAVSTDGHRLALVDSAIEAVFPSVILPRKTVGLVKWLLDEGSVTVSASDTKVRFDFGHSVVVSKVIDGTYPDYSRIIPTGWETEVTVNANDVKQAAALVSEVSGDRIRAVKVAVGTDVVTLTVRSGIDVGVEEVDAVVTGDSVEVGVNSKYLAEILKACNGDNAVMRFRGSGDAIVVKPEEDDKALFLVMPMRV